MKKRILILAMVLALCLAFSGCTMESMRNSHAICDADGNITWNGQLYIPLPENNLVNVLVDYEKDLYITDGDVPVLLSTVFGEGAGVSKDGKFLEGWYGKTYCRSDCYEQYKDYVPGKVELDHYCYDAYSTGEYQLYQLDDEQTRLLDQLLGEAQEQLIDPDVFFSQPMSWITNLSACTGDLVAYKQLCEVYTLNGQYCFVRYDEEDGSYYLKTLPADVRESLDAVFEKVDG